VLVKSMEINELAMQAEVETAESRCQRLEVWAAVHYAMTRNRSELPAYCFWISGRNPKEL